MIILNLIIPFIATKQDQGIIYIFFEQILFLENGFCVIKSHVLTCSKEK